MRTPALIGALLICVADTPSETPTTSVSDPSVPIRKVRVLVAQDVRRLRIRPDQSLQVESADGRTEALPASDDWLTVSSSAHGGLLVGALRTGKEPVRIQSVEKRPITLSVRRRGEWNSERTYAGSLQLLVDDSGRIDVINHVDVEHYVACVVAHEVWPTFEIEAVRAQSVAARTFVLFQMKRRTNSAFDVAATQGAQVYKGVRDDPIGRRAGKATQATRGLVLTWDGDGPPQLFCAYYSAACGGLSQSAAIFGPVNDIKPLSGGVRCTYCKIAPGETYRWGPVTIGLDKIFARVLAADPDLKALEKLEDIQVIDRTAAKRPVRLRLIGSSGEAHDMLAERFRLLVNGSQIRSTDFRLRVRRGKATFDRGRGFGHGLGLCQWGMQGQALAGKHAADILRYYYPGASLTRVY